MMFLRTSEVTVICANVAPKLVFDREDPILYYVSVSIYSCWLYS